MKRFSSSSKFKRTHVKENSSFRVEESKMSIKYYDSVNGYKSSSQVKKRPYFHQLIVDNQPTNVRICNDLLGAGLDPLTCNTNHSKLIDQKGQLIAK